MENKNPNIEIQLPQSSPVQPINYLTDDNNVKAFFQLPNAQLQSIPSILSSDDRKLWLSPQNLNFPHVLILDVSQSQTKPKHFRYFGFSCWHAYNSNPAQIKILFSFDGQNYVQWQTIKPELKAGKQVFKLKDKIGGNEVKYMKLEIIKNFGEKTKDRVYINQVMLYENYQVQAKRMSYNSEALSAATTSIQDDQLSHNTNFTSGQPKFPQFMPHSYQIKTLETQFDADQPLSYQNSIDSTYLAIQNYPLQNRLSQLLSDLDALQQQSTDQFLVIQNLKQVLESEESPNADLQLFFNGLQIGYQSIQTQMSILQDNINNMSHSYTHYESNRPSQNHLYRINNQLHQHFATSTSQDLPTQPTHQQQQCTDHRQSTNLNDTSTFRANKHPQQNPTPLLDRQDLILQCMEQCQRYIQVEFQKVYQQQHEVKTLQQSKRFEKSLEKRIEKFIASQSKQTIIQQTGEKEERQQQPIIIKQLSSERGQISSQQKKNDVQKIAYELQQKLAMKAKKLQELQDRDESKITMSSQSQSSNNSSVISNCSSLLKLNDHHNQIRRHQEIEVPTKNHAIQNLSRVFEYDVNDEEIINHHHQQDTDEDVEQQIEKYFIASHNHQLTSLDNQ